MPGWLQAFVKVNPITHLVSAVRGLMIGGPVADHLLLDAASGWPGCSWCSSPLALRGLPPPRLTRRPCPAGAVASAAGAAPRRPTACVAVERAAPRRSRVEVGGPRSSRSCAVSAATIGLVAVLGARAAARPRRASAAASAVAPSARGQQRDRRRATTAMIGRSLRRDRLRVAAAQVLAGRVERRPSRTARRAAAACADGAAVRHRAASARRCVRAAPAQRRRRRGASRRRRRRTSRCDRGRLTSTSTSRSSLARRRRRGSSAHRRRVPRARSSGRRRAAAGRPAAS